MEVLDVSDLGAERSVVGLHVKGNGAEYKTGFRRERQQRGSIRRGTRYERHWCVHIRRGMKRETHFHGCIGSRIMSCSEAPAWGYSSGFRHVMLWRSPIRCGIRSTLACVTPI